MPTRDPGQNVYAYDAYGLPSQTISELPGLAIGRRWNRVRELASRFIFYRTGPVMSGNRQRHY